MTLAPVARSSTPALLFKRRTIKENIEIKVEKDGFKEIQSFQLAQRQLVQVDRSELWKGKPVKNLTEGLTKSGGRNNSRSHYYLAARWRSQASLSVGRLQAS